jgi:nitrite reductase/ring-hydroxylating ferredoxin subunit
VSRSFSSLFPRKRADRQPGTGPRRVPRPAEAARRVAHAQGLDGAARALTDATLQRIGTGAGADALHGVWLGQPVHPALTSLPMGFWTSATVLDFVPGSQRASRALIALGLAGSVPAAAAGLADWSALHREQQRVGLAHAAANASAWALFAGSLMARAAGRELSGRALALGGLATLTVGAYGRVTRRQLGYLSLAVVRQGSDVMVLADRCAHLGGPLHQGTLTEADGEPCLSCPWHGSTYRLSDGAVVHGPATARQPAFDTRIADGGIVQVRPAG